MRAFRLPGVIAAFLVIVSAPALALAQALPIQAEIDRVIAETQGKQLQKRLADMRAHYEANAWTPVWIEGGKPSQKAWQAIDALAKANEDGLRSSDYGAEELARKFSANTPQQLADLEIHLSTAAISFAQHLSAGRVTPKEVNRELVRYPKAIETGVVLDSFRRTGNVKAYLRLLAPHTGRYERLRAALAAYRAIEARGGWSTVPEGPVLKPGANDPRIAAVRQRMIEEGLLDAGLASSTAYDETLAKAVIAFQERMGLEAVGTIGPQTLGAMNAPVSKRIEMMELNLERNRWMQNDLGPYHIFANLADQVVKVVRNEDTVHAEVIQVGQPYHRTPEFSDVMEYIEFNPYWGVPPSIAVNEYLPKLRSNPGVLAAQNIELFSGGGKISPQAVNWSSYGKGNFPFSLRQKPGPDNALGRVKFMFPNEFNVYMHDTPSKSKFEAASRYFSHGCLRLKDPLTMAEVLLEAEGWDRARIDAVVKGGKNTEVRLKTPIPVHIAYLTAFVNRDGSVHFREDVYGRDKLLKAALDKVRGR